MSKQVWEQLEDGNYDSFMYVDNGGKLLGIFAGDDYTDWYATHDLPDHIRLCRKVDAAPVVPSGVAATIREALRKERIHIEMSDLDKAHEAREFAKVDAALAWLNQLDQQEGGGDGKANAHTD